MGYVVARGHSVVLKGAQLVEGNEVPGNLSGLPEMIRSGHVVKSDARDGSAEAEPKDFRESPTLKPGSVVTDAGTPLFQPRPAPVIEIKAEVVKAPEPVLVKVASPGKWNVDPAITKGLSLVALNVMVLERDPTVKPFETVEEAAAQLSADFPRS